ncbi:MAG: hypothetical protein H0X66_20180 [Verrucomicrobia bacterium]|nr:hypothetical protein [Verrucomicrobiota bacterium]
MANTTTAKHGSLGKKLGIIFGVIVLLVIVLYFIVTSTAFFKGVILPRVSKAVGADVTVADASISPFSRIELQKLRVQPPNQEPILQAEQVVARYSLMDIVRGNLNVHELTLVSPVIRIVEDAEGKSNLDPIIQPDAPAAEPKKDEQPPQINIRNVTVKNGTLQLVTKLKDGGEDVTELSNLNVQLDQLRNGASGKLELSSNVRLQSPGTAAAPNLMSGTLSGNFNFTLDQNLAPKNAKGTGQFVATNASGDYSELAGLTARLNTDLSPTQVQDLSVEFLRGGQRLGLIRANGPLDVSKQEGRLNVAMESIDRNVLNLFGASQGIDFGKTQINSTNTVELSKAGQFVSVQGQFRMNQFSVTQTNQTTPVVDLVAEYNVTVDQPNETALINTFTLNGTQNNRPLLNGSLSRPMQLNWGTTNGAVDESAFALNVTNLNLADWRAFAGDLNPAGTAGLRLNAVSQSGGSRIQFDLTSQLQNFSAQFDTNKIQNADITLLARGQLADLKNLNLTESRIELTQGGQRAAAATASGTYGLESGDADMKATLNLILPRLFQLVQVADSKADSGRLTFNGQVKQTKNQQTVTGNFAIEDFTGNYGEYILQNYNVSSEMDVQQTEHQLQVRRMVASLRQGNQEGGAIQVSGNLNTETSIGSFEVKLNGLNENGLRPFIAPSLGERKLNSILMNGNVTAKLNSTNSYAVQADLNVANLVIVEPGQTTPPMPLAAKLNADVSLEGQAMQIRTLTANVNYGGNPAGQFDVVGNYNLETERGKLDLKLVGLNQNAVRPFMPKIGDKDLVTISINGTASANLESPDDQAIKADFKIADLVVRDPNKPQAEAPLGAQLQLDAGMTKAIVELRQLQLNLSPTDRAKNQLLVKGRLDRSNTNAINGNVAITSDSFDVTQFYNLYTGGDETAQQATPGATRPGIPPQATAQPADANEEPEPMNLPVGKITLTANIGQFFLREIAVTDLKVNGGVAGNRVTLSPMQMTMNGAPMKADVDVDLGVRGYGYKISFSADHVPLQPIANSFMPENRDRYQGQIVANGNITTIGTTGTSLRQHLNGEIGFTFTNANINFGTKLQPILNVIATAIRVPEVAESPIDWIGTDLQFGNGQIQISRSIVRSEAIRAWLQGPVPIADILTNSPLNLPIRLDLRRSLASKLPKEIFLEDTNPQAKYVQLPQFLRVRGTLGNPSPEVDRNSLLKGAAGAVIQQVAPEILKGDTGRFIQGIIGGRPPAQTNAPPDQQGQPASTNQAPSSPGKRLFDKFIQP